jgi:predicted histone-like DNA-binding protein
VKEKELAERLSKETTLNPKEAEMAIYLLFREVKDLLATSHTVQLGDLGSFRVTATTEGAAASKEVSASNIKKLNVRFTESDGLKAAMKEAKVLDVESILAK